MNSENSKTSEPHLLILNLTDKINLQRGEKSNAVSKLSIFYAKENIKTHTKTINLKYQLQRGKINSNYQTNHILYLTFKIILCIS